MEKAVGIAAILWYAIGYGAIGAILGAIYGVIAAFRR
jgi:hypothetical protein